MSGFFLAAALTVEVYYLMRDIPVFEETRTAHEAKLLTPPIAELVKRTNQVQVQAPGELVWDDARDGQILRRRQSVLTLEGAKAEIAFLDGTGLVVDENSLVQLEKTPSDDSLGYQKIVIRLMRGAIHKMAPRKTSDILKGTTTVTPGISIETGAATIELNPDTELSVVASPERPGAAAEIRVQSGEARVEQPDRAPLTVTRGESATVSKAAAPEVRKSPFVLLSPRGGESQAPGELRFRWNVDADLSSQHAQELEISSDPDFSHVVKRARIAATVPPLEHVETAVSLEGEDGAYYWRVRAVGKSGTASEGERFFLQARPRPEALFPRARAQATAGAPLQLSWKPVENAIGYDVELLDDHGKPEARAVSEPVITLEHPDVGAVQWKVRARLKDGTATPWSDPRSVVIMEGAPPPPPSELGEPDFAPGSGPAPGPAPAHTWLERARDRLWGFVAGAEAWAGEATRVPANADSYTVHLQWGAVKGVHKYKVQIGRERTFTHIVSEAETTQAWWNWTYTPGVENTKGRLFYRVASVNERGVVGGFSQPKPIQVPEEILAHHQKKLETFAATEAGEPMGDPTDAEGSGNLDTLAKPVLKKSVSESGKLVAKPVGPGYVVPNHITPAPKPVPTAPWTGVPQPEVPPAKTEAAVNVTSEPSPRPEPRPTSSAEAFRGGTPAPEPAIAATDVGTPAPGPVAQVTPALPVATPAAASPAAATPAAASPAAASPAAATPAAASPVAETASAADARPGADNRLNWTLGLHAGIGNLSQSSDDTGIHNVGPSSAFAQQKVSASLELTRILGESWNQWTLATEFGAASFSRDSIPKAADQPSITAHDFRLDFLGRAKVSGLDRSVRVFWGWRVDRLFRWVKSGPQTVDTEGALSLGPSAFVVRNYDYGSPFLPSETGAGLSVPVTGIVTGGFFGWEGTAWGEWKLAKFNAEETMRLGLKTSVDVGLTRWSSPSSTNLYSWSFWIAPVFHFGPGPQDMPVADREMREFKDEGLRAPGSQK